MKCGVVESFAPNYGDISFEQTRQDVSGFRKLFPWNTKFTFGRSANMEDCVRKDNLMQESRFIQRRREKI